MTERYKVIYSKGETEVHFIGAGQNDYALCGQDLIGDGDLDGRGSYGSPKLTKAKVNCPHCIRIVEHCKKIGSSEYQKQKQ